MTAFNHITTLYNYTVSLVWSHLFTQVVDSVTFAQNQLGLTSCREDISSCVAYVLPVTCTDIVTCLAQVYGRVSSDLGGGLKCPLQSYNKTRWTNQCIYIYIETIEWFSLTFTCFVYSHHSHGAMVRESIMSVVSKPEVSKLALL